MKICHVITRFIRGGADENTLFTCNGQAQNGHEVHLVMGREWHAFMRDRLDPAVVQHVLPPLRQPISPLYDLGALFGCWRLFARHRFDLVHTHTSKAGVVGRIAAWFAGTPIIVHGVHIVPWVSASRASRQLYIVLERLAARFTDAFVDVGPAMRNECLANGIGTSDRHHLVPSGMDIERFAAAGRARRPDWRKLIDPSETDTDDPVFLILVSALEERKGQRRFLPVFRDIARADPRAVLIMLGEGRERDAILSDVDRLGLTGRVVLAGFRDDVERWIALGDICLLTSRSEGLPRVLVQYALVGRPLVATDIPGSADVVQSEDNGFLVSPNSLKEMERPILRLLTDETLRTRIGHTNATMDFTPWTIGEMVQRQEKLYRQLAQAEKRE